MRLKLNFILKFLLFLYVDFCIVDDSIVKAEEPVGKDMDVVKGRTPDNSKSRIHYQNELMISFGDFSDL
jgi:hypothetical protein